MENVWGDETIKIYLLKAVGIWRFLWATLFFLGSLIPKYGVIWPGGLRALQNRDQTPTFSEKWHFFLPVFDKQPRGRIRGALSPGPHSTIFGPPYAFFCFFSLTQLFAKLAFFPSFFKTVISGPVNPKSIEIFDFHFLTLLKKIFL